MVGLGQWLKCNRERRRFRPPSSLFLISSSKDKNVVRDRVEPQPSARDLFDKAHCTQLGSSLLDGVLSVEADDSFPLFILLNSPKPSGTGPSVALCTGLVRMTAKSVYMEKSKNREDPAMYRPTAQGIHLEMILQQASCTGWLTKYRPPTFAFLKSSKKRYVVLVDRLLYTFKSDTPDMYRDFFEITPETHAYVTDGMGVPYCIEVRKYPDTLWILQAGDVDTMKRWLGTIKRVIAWLRLENQSLFLSKKRLDSIQIEPEYKLSRSSLSLKPVPPQLPPPTCLPPPIPSALL
ncbi:hypothetical protein BY458DRAFT_494568 [Sporodiniella umbellata]|nr:hypothetical protein BY458DRAFT_494568 [Sporodiniella umbellata]